MNICSCPTSCSIMGKLFVGRGYLNKQMALLDIKPRTKIFVGADARQIWEQNLRVGFTWDL